MNKKVIMHKEICDKLNETYEKKNNDYGDSFAKVRTIVPDAIMVRIYDKVSRLETLLKKENKQLVNDESIEDTLTDLANYCIMEVIERNLDKNQNKEVKECSVD